MRDARAGSGALLWLVAPLLLIGDQLTKALVLAKFHSGDVNVVIPHVLQWVLVHNTRGAYGLFGDRPWFLITISLVAFAVIFLAFRERAARSRVTAIALGLVLGGAIGNIIDRFHYGFVVDFIRIPFLPFFEVFNIADMGISFGIVTIVLLNLRNERPYRHSA